MELTLERLIDLAGPLNYDSTASEKLRTMLREEFTHDDIETWLFEAMGGTETYHHKALQDIVNSLGERLGFRAEYGVYAGKASPIPCDGLWSTDDLNGETTYIVVETKKSANFADDPENQPGKYMAALSEEQNISPHDIYGLIVIGEGDLGPPVDAVRESKCDGRVRIISVQRLLDLLYLKRRYVTSHHQIARLLVFPDLIDVDSLVGLADEFTDRADFWRRVRHEAGVHRNGTDLEFDDDLFDKDNLENFVRFMFESGLLDKSDLPICVDDQWYINTEPVKKGGDMGSPVKIEEGVYLETNSPKPQKKRIMERLALEYGLRK